MNAAWGDDPTTFFTDTFLQVVPGDTFSWAPAWSVMIPLALVWVLVLFVIGRGLSKGVEAANKVFLPLLVILFLALVVRALFLPGAVEGLNAFFTPNWGALADPKVWLAAFAQIFYSLSVGFGIMLTYASYLQRKSNLTGTALVAGFANSSFEILADLPDASPAVQAVLSADTQESADEAVAALWESSLAWFDRSERPDVLALHKG